MEHHTGWKPMPVLLKIVWILTLIGVVFSIFMIFSVYGTGSEILGFRIYGLRAVNFEFFLSLVIPVILLIAMVRRNRWTWLFGVIFYLLSAINGLFGFRGFEEKVTEFMSLNDEMPKFPGMDQVQIDRAFYWNIMAAMIIVSALVNLAFVVFFIIKRKYFYLPVPVQEEQSKENE